MTIHQDIDKVFKEGLKEYSERPPAFVWDGIEQNLNKKRNKKRRNIIYSVAASLALLLAFGAGYTFTHINTQNLVADNSVGQIKEVENTNIQIAPRQENDPVNTVGGDENPEKDEFPSNKELEIKPEKKKQIENTLEEKEFKRDQPKKESKIKKVKSSGSLLPPMYASESVVQNAETEQNIIADNNTEESQNENIHNIEPIDFKRIELPNVEYDKQLSYSAKQLNNFAGYTLVKNETDDYTNWSVGVSGAPLLSYRDVVSASPELAYGADINSNYEQNYANEKPLMSYTAGVNVNYNVSKRWKVQSGVYYAEMGQISENVKVYEQPAYVAEDNTYSINTSVGNVAVVGNQNQLIGSISAESKNNDYLYEQTPILAERNTFEEASMETDFVQTYEFYEIPLLVDYLLVDKKLAVNVSGGLSTNILYANNTFVQNNGTRMELDAEAENLRRMNYSGVVGIGIEYPLLSKLKVNMKPTFRYSLSSINNSGAVYPYSFGVYTGLRYDF